MKYEIGKTGEKIAAQSCITHILYSIFHISEPEAQP